MNRRQAGWCFATLFAASCVVDEDASADAAGLAARDAPDAALCPDPPPPLRTCFRGAAFADCGGEFGPRVFCEAEGWDCLWFGGGCPAADYTVACSEGSELKCPPSAGCERAAELHLAWGAEPWDAERAMLRGVRIDPTVVESEPWVACECNRVDADGTRPETAGCLPGGSNPCTPGPDEEPPYEGVTRALHPRAGDAGWALPSLVQVSIHRPDLGGWTVIVEVDLRGAAPYNGRVCAIEYTDALGSCVSRGPVCATRAALLLDRLPATIEEVQALHGSFNASFPQLPLFPRDPGAGHIDGLSLNGGF